MLGNTDYQEILLIPLLCYQIFVSHGSIYGYQQTQTKSLSVAAVSYMLQINSRARQFSMNNFRWGIW
jgi:hypothetical protein